MKKTFTTEQTCCDCCETKLIKRSVFLNDGSYQGDYVTKGDIDLCYLCAGILLDINIIDTIDDVKLKEFLDVTKKRMNPMRFGSDNLNVKLFLNADKRMANSDRCISNELIAHSAPDSLLEK